MKIHSKDKRSKKRGASPGKNAVQETPTPGFFHFAILFIMSIFIILPRYTKISRLSILFCLRKNGKSKIMTFFV